MSLRARVEAQALRAVAKSVRNYADNLYIDYYSNDQRGNERDESIQEHFRGLADKLEQDAVDIAAGADIDCDT